MGLTLKEEKTRVCHTYHTYEGMAPGFNFLGFHVRQHRTNTNTVGYTTLIKPGKESLKQHLYTIRGLLRNHRGESQDTVIRNLNPIIKGWCNYYRWATARKIFEKASHQTFEKLWRWARYRHPHKGRRWVKDRYFLSHKNNNWRFKTHDGKILVMHYDFKIRQYVKVKGTKSPFDGDFTYWASRMGKYPMLPTRVASLLKKQQGKCGDCKLFFKSEDVMEVHHIDGKRNNNKAENLLLLHGHCHDQLHGRCMYEKHQVTEEPDVLKGTSPVLEPSMGGDAHT
jgi:RNA-directed DNA polymerase